MSTLVRFGASSCRFTQIPNDYFAVPIEHLCSFCSQHVYEFSSACGSRTMSAASNWVHQRPTKLRVHFLYSSQAGPMTVRPPLTLPLTGLGQWQDTSFRRERYPSRICKGHPLSLALYCKTMHWFLLWICFFLYFVFEPQCSSPKTLHQSRRRGERGLGKWQFMARSERFAGGKAPRQAPSPNPHNEVQAT